MNEGIDNLVAISPHSATEFGVVGAWERKAESGRALRGGRVQGAFPRGRATSSFSLSGTLTPDAPCFPSTTWLLRAWLRLRKYWLPKWLISQVEQTIEPQGQVRALGLAGA